MAAITKLVVETVRERDDTEFTHHNQTLEMGTTKVQTSNASPCFTSGEKKKDKQMTGAVF